MTTPDTAQGEIHEGRVYAIAASDHIPPHPEVERLRAELARVNAAPVATRTADGTIRVEWPDGAESCLMAREVLAKMLFDHDETRAQLVEVDDLRSRLSATSDAANHARNEAELLRRQVAELTAARDGLTDVGKRLAGWLREALDGWDAQRWETDGRPLAPRSTEIRREAGLDRCFAAPDTTPGNDQ